MCSIIYRVCPACIGTPEFSKEVTCKRGLKFHIYFQSKVDFLCVSPKLKGINARLLWVVSRAGYLFWVLTNLFVDSISQSLLTAPTSKAVVSFGYLPHMCVHRKSLKLIQGHQTYTVSHLIPSKHRFHKCKTIMINVC